MGMARNGVQASDRVVAFFSELANREIGGRREASKPRMARIYANDFESLLKTGRLAPFR
jgi:hypothetical protein